MDVVYNLLLVLHLIGWAIVLGATLVSFREPKVPTASMHGILTALIGAPVFLHILLRRMAGTGGIA